MDGLFLFLNMNVEEIYIKYDQLLEQCRLVCEDGSIPKIEKAFHYSKTILKDKKFTTGEGILSHSLDVALIIASEIGLGVNSVITGLLHNVMYSELEEKADPGYIIDEFGELVFNILEGMAKINSLGTDTVDLHSENYRKLLLALAGDMRVILIKIADRLQVMRNLDSYKEEVQSKLVSETTHLYAPLAHRLGLYKVNSEFLDLCLRYNKRDEYNDVLEHLLKTEEARNNFVVEFVKPIEKKLLKKGFKFEMKARTKSIYSIWNKMQKKEVSFDEVLDLFAIRVILDSKDEHEKADCWTVYSIITEEYQTNTERLRDWITIPKSNGYESLHTTVMGPYGKWVEIQIRTQRMDEIAEKGLAAHWKYKGGGESKELDKWLTGIRDVLENPEISIVDFIDDFKISAYEDEIFVFTPKGDLIKLPKGATMLDFAYEIHSDLGDKCVGGKIDGRKVTLKHKLTNGDYVAIDTSASQKPKIDWLEFVVTSKAKTRIKSSLNEEKKREAANGKELLLRKLKNWKIDYNEEVIRTMLKHFNYKLAIDLYYNISLGKVEPLEIKSLLTKKEEDTTKDKINELLPQEDTKEFSFEGGDDFLIIDNNLKNVNYKLAQCCNPVLGDTIFGFVTIKDGIKIHRKSCPNAPDMISRFPYRVIKAKWKNSSTRNSFLASIYITGTEQESILTGISNVIAKDIGVQMRALKIESDLGTFQASLNVLVYNLEHLDFLMLRLKNVNGVISVSRKD